MGSLLRDPGDLHGVSLYRTRFYVECTHLALVVEEVHSKIELLLNGNSV